jgi:hypothetical protein
MQICQSSKKWEILVFVNYINIILDTVHHLCFQENGVHQEQVLSVTLFAFAINNTADAVGPSVSTSLYVDDITVFYGSSTYKHK